MNEKTAEKKTSKPLSDATFMALQSKIIVSRTYKQLSSSPTWEIHYISFLNTNEMSSEIEENLVTQNEKESSYESELKVVFSNIPLLTVIIIVFGLIKETVYYYKFGISIKHFIGISEMGVVIFDDLIYSIGGVIQYIFYMPLFLVD